MSITPFNPTGELVLLYKIAGADMQSTSDQLMTVITSNNTCMPHNLIAVPVSGKATVACTGGVYTAASKSGSPIVSASVSTWVNLDATSNPKIGLKLGSFGSQGNLSSNNAIISTQTPYLSLTTGSTGACTADIYIYGFVLS